MGPNQGSTINRLGEMLKLNAWIKEFNTNNNFMGVLPNYQTWDYEMERSVDVSEERVFRELFCSSVCHKHHLEGGVEYSRLKKSSRLINVPLICVTERATHTLSLGKDDFWS